MLELAQTGRRRTGPVRKRWYYAQKCGIRDVAAFQKYNSSARIIGFPPRLAPIIDQSGNLEATSN
jgi:hypothetical protein